MAYVYILENKDVKRIKIGATIHHPDARLTDIARMWRAFKGRCQICLCWRILDNGRMPKHVLSMSHCKGSGEPPLEYSTKLAEKQLDDLQDKFGKSNYATKRIKNLQKVIQNYKKQPIRAGTWKLNAFFKTDSAYQIEEHTHQVLAAYLDKDAPFGEVFTCSAEEAINVIEKAIRSQAT